MAIQSTTMKYGAPHITSSQMGSFNAGIFGTGAYVLNTRNKFALSVNSANSITIGTGDAVCNGRHFVLESPETLSVDSGTQSLKRKDLVCLRYTKSGDVETPSIVVIKGTASTDPVDPQYNTGSILDGATIVDFPLYRLNIDGINFASYDTIFELKELGGNKSEILWSGSLLLNNDTAKTISLSDSILNYELIVFGFETGQGDEALSSSVSGELMKLKHEGTGTYGRILIMPFTRHNPNGLTYSCSFCARTIANDPNQLSLWKDYSSGWNTPVLRNIVGINKTKEQ